MSGKEIYDTRLAHSRLSGECQLNLPSIGMPPKHNSGAVAEAFRKRRTVESALCLLRVTSCARQAQKRQRSRLLSRSRATLLKHF
jgi:hypothetical protein